MKYKWSCNSRKWKTYIYENPELIKEKAGD